MDLSQIISISDIQEQAKLILDPSIYTYFSGGSDDEITLSENAESYNKVLLKPRVLRDVRNITTRTTVLGQSISLPVLIAPMAFHKLAHQEGEIATVKAASDFGTIMIVSSLATASLEEIRKNSLIDPWLQVYMYKDRHITKNLLQYAHECGFKGLVLTVDTPLYGKRKRELINPFSFQEDIIPLNLVKAGLNLQEIPVVHRARYLSQLLDSSLTWEDIEWIRSITPLPIILKGILTEEDVSIAIEHKISGIIISNHGGRQLDTVPTPLEVLPKIAQIADGKIDILIDGGIRDGKSIFKAIALGAKAVLIGRPILWGLSVGGEHGVLKVLDIFSSELNLTMALCGCTSLEMISEEYLYKRITYF
ncbi:MAG: alpha-hydroxy-acid oxidizing protein [Proteobacteria bacterium]|nr:alpha-hydroxy-acid oxidizing protein [Pseudomonadota bacterium]